MLSTVCFRHVPAGVPADQLDLHNQRLAGAMQRHGRGFLAPAVLDGRTCLRVCFVNFRKTPDDVAEVLPAAAELATGLTAGLGHEAGARVRRRA